MTETKKMKEKYLLLYLKTGGGHLAPAKSVCTFLQEQYEQKVDPILIDGFEKAPHVVRWVVEDGYRFLQSKARWVYRFLYLTNKVPWIAHANSAIISAVVKPFFKDLILKERPEKIVIFHFFLIKPIHDILRELKLTIPVMTVVTDPFTAHPLWFLEKNVHFIVFSEELRRYCIKRGIAEEKVSVFPFVIEEKFSRPLSDDMVIEQKKKLGFRTDKKIVLIMGGADGIPNGLAILKNLVAANREADIAMVCGRNIKLFSEAMQWKEKNEYGDVKIYGYVDFVYELLNIADIVITKCGASMFMQTLLSKKVPIVNNYLWGQEKGNIDFLTQNEVGIYERRVRKLPGLVNKIIYDRNVYHTFTSNIEKARLENGVSKVSEFILEFGNI